MSAASVLRAVVDKLRSCELVRPAGKRVEEEARNFEVPVGARYRLQLRASLQVVPTNGRAPWHRAPKWEEIERAVEAVLAEVAAEELDGGGEDAPAGGWLDRWEDERDAAMEGGGE